MFNSTPVLIDFAFSYALLLAVRFVECRFYFKNSGRMLKECNIIDPIPNLFLYAKP